MKIFFALDMMTLDLSYGMEIRSWMVESRAVNVVTAQNFSSETPQEKNSRKSLWISWRWVRRRFVEICSFDSKDSFVCENNELASRKLSAIVRIVRLLVFCGADKTISSWRLNLSEHLGRKFKASGWIDCLLLEPSIRVLLSQKCFIIALLLLFGLFTND